MRTQKIPLEALLDIDPSPLQGAFTSIAHLAYVSEPGMLTTAGVPRISVVCWAKEES